MQTENGSKRTHPRERTEQRLWQLIQDTINAQIRNVCESSAALTNARKGATSRRSAISSHGHGQRDLNKNGIMDLKNDFDMIDAIKD